MQCIAMQRNFLAPLVLCFLELCVALTVFMSEMVCPTLVTLVFILLSGVGEIFFQGRTSQMLVRPSC